ncbi:MAG: aminodeoxychorismate synthase component I [Steroidobacterales bacterium]
MPDCAVLRQLAYREPLRYPVLFDSASTAAGDRRRLGRYSILAAFPHGAIWLDAARQLHGSGTLTAGAGFLNTLERCWRAEAQVEQDSNGMGLPFRGGWVVFLGYELALEIEPRLQLPPSREPIGAFALRVPAALIYDHAEACGYAVAEDGFEALLDELATDVAAAAAAPAAVSSPDARLAAPRAVHEEEPRHFRARVQRTLDYIRAGDIYQANLSRPWQIELAADVTPQAVYERLRSANPAPFAAWARFRELTVLSSSPERLVRTRGARIETRPIAGTHSRSRSPGHDDREAEQLLANPKERAEHVMLIDLERNDLGRVCRAGSVRADEFMVLESYEHVHHIVSNVSGTLRTDVTPIDVLRAVFPGGTITGCPKFRCMQIIAELEGEGRNAYTGSLGYLNRDGSMDFNILIRTLSMRGSTLHFRAGAGIVADSNWERELQETRAKAQGLLEAVAATG